MKDQQHSRERDISPELTAEQTLRDIHAAREHIHQDHASRLEAFDAVHKEQVQRDLSSQKESEQGIQETDGKKDLQEIPGHDAAAAPNKWERYLEDAIAQWQAAQQAFLKRDLAFLEQDPSLLAAVEAIKRDVTTLDGRELEVLDKEAFLDAIYADYEAGELDVPNDQQTEEKALDNSTHERSVPDDRDFER